MYIHIDILLTFLKEDFSKSWNLYYFPTTWEEPNPVVRLWFADGCRRIFQEKTQDAMDTAREIIPEQRTSFPN
jgi:hypothetical protein